MTETADVVTPATEEQPDSDPMIAEALRLIDGGLADLMHRELVSTDEVSDLLLDVRMILTAAELDKLVEEAPVGA